MIALPKKLTAHVCTLIVSAVLVFVSVNLSFVMLRAHNAYVDIHGTSGIMDYDAIYVAKDLFFKHLNHTSSIYASVAVFIFFLAIMLLYKFNALRARAAICVVSSLVLLTLGHMSVKPWHHELAHYYTHSTYRTAICGQSVVKWLHRLEGDHRDPAAAIHAKKGRQYFYGPHAFQRGEGYSPFDGPPASHD
jgi:hypothetical protein